MSKKQQNILISPPMFLDNNNNVESIKSVGHICSVCSGAGYYWEDDVEGPVQHKCKMCDGTGKLDAEITIKWKSSKNKEK